MCKLLNAKFEEKVEVKMEKSFLVPAKLKKKPLSLITSLILVISLCVPLSLMAVSGESAQNDGGIYGSAESGFEYSDDLINTPLKSLYNGDFSEGFKYWGEYKSANKEGGINPKIEDGVLKITPDVDKIGMQSAPFKFKYLEYGDRMKVSFDYKITDKIHSVCGILQVYNDGKWVDAVEIKTNNANNYNCVDKGNGWKNIPFEFDVTKTSHYLGRKENVFTEELFKSGTPLMRFVVYINAFKGDNDNIVYKNPGDVSAEFDNIEVAFLDGYGTWGDAKNATAISNFNNFDFSEELNDWVAVDPNASQKNPANAYAALQDDGTLKFMGGKQYAGISTVNFNLNIDTSRKLMLVYNCKTNSFNDFSVTLTANDTVVFNSANNELKIADLGNGWYTYRTYLQGATTNIDNTSKLRIQIQQAGVNLSGETYFSKFELVYADKVNENLYECFDTTPFGHDMGDANYDGTVNICDLVRIKKYLSNETEDIYFSAANLNKKINEDGSIDWDDDATKNITSADLIELQKKLLLG